MSSDGGVRLNDPSKDLQDLSQSLIKGAQDAVNRAGRNIGDPLKDYAYAISTGDFNNIGNTMINQLSHVLTLGQMDPNLESGRERKNAADLTAKELKDMQDATNYSNGLAADQQRKVLNILEGGARSRMRAPGSAATLITPSGTTVPTSNTLVTTARGKFNG